MNPSLYAPIYPPSLHFTTLLDNLNTFTFPSVHHINHFPNPLSKSIWSAERDGPILKGISPNIRPLPPVPDFPYTVNPAQIVGPLQSVTYIPPRPFSRVRFEELLRWISMK
jgi:hypothetical protein